MATILSFGEKLSFLRKISAMYCSHWSNLEQKYIVLDQKRENLQEITEFFFNVVGTFNDCYIDLKARQTILMASMRLEKIYSHLKHHELKSRIDLVIDRFRKYSYERFFRDFKRDPIKSDSDLVMLDFVDGPSSRLTEDEKIKMMKKCIFFINSEFIINFEISEKRAELSAFSPFIGLLESSSLRIDIWGNPWVKNPNGDVNLNEFLQDLRDYIGLFLVDLIDQDVQKRSLEGLSAVEKMNGYRIIQKVKDFYKKYHKIQGKNIWVWMGYLIGKGSSLDMKNLEEMDRLFSVGWI